MKLKKKDLKDLVMKLRGKCPQTENKNEDGTPVAEPAATPENDDNKDGDQPPVAEPAAEPAATPENDADENKEDEDGEEDPTMAALKVMGEKIDLVMDGLAAVLEVMEGSKTEESDDVETEEEETEDEDEGDVDPDKVCEDDEDEDDEDKNADELDNMSDDEALKLLEDLDEELEDMETGAN